MEAPIAAFGPLDLSSGTASRRTNGPREHEPFEDAYWRILPRPSENVIRRWDDLTVEERIDAAFPGPVDHRHWSQSERDVYIVRISALLIEDMERTFATHHRRDARGQIVCTSEEDRQNFVFTLGWALGAWPGKLSCETALKLFGINCRTVRDATLLAFERDLYLIREVAEQLYPETQTLVLH